MKMIKLLGTAISFNGIPLSLCVSESLDNEFIINEVLLAPVTKAQKTMNRG